VTSSFDMPASHQNLVQGNTEPLVSWIHAVLDVLWCRSDALACLVDTHHCWRIDPAADSDGAPATATVRVDWDAWVLAVAAASRPLPAPVAAFPAPAAPAAPSQP
jgi:hypothetical protein